MYKTKIEWCDTTFNPITGCLHGCEYCYARAMANRFKGCDKASTYGVHCQATWKRINPKSSPDKAMFEVDSKCPPVTVRFNPKTQKNDVRVAPYPWGFQPTLRRDKIESLAHYKTPRTIFVGSMSDMFGDWTPDNWLNEVFEACKNSPQHRYLFLTKNPLRYLRYGVPKTDNMWYGTSVTREADVDLIGNLPSECNTFISAEPLLEDLNVELHGLLLRKVDWIIVGAETGNRKSKVVPQREWIEKLICFCREQNIPLFMKDSLAPVIGEENMVREFPWERGVVYEEQSL